MTQVPQGPKDKVCPFHRKSMSKVCHACPMWVLVRGHNPNTGGDVDRWDCSFALQPMLMIENSQQQRQTAAAVNSFHNEMSRNQAAALLGDYRRPGSHIASITPIRNGVEYPQISHDDGDAS